MKLVSIACPHCGAKLQTTPNAKILSCDYCNNDIMIDDEVKLIVTKETILQDANDPENRLAIRAIVPEESERISLSALDAVVPEEFRGLYAK